eukprot:CAMPEP_0173104648 /NCGR_PEP_ID=MMETSP1102-20130122/39427_1 /TAXON_ID=49646 /ORGANISM="Geminigera sp., Strain Caron Lab Isolate" /LENGTH=217 /DNA_ID=CAMNT_0014000327 /DNA_START=18 /DNA_END=671 /DNA_ORIENTATION=+
MHVAVALLAVLLPGCDAFGGALLGASTRGIALNGRAASCSLSRENRFSMNLVTHYEELPVPTGRGFSMVDITLKIKAIVEKTEVQEGVVTVLSKHSTVSVTINEMESRLVDDTKQFVHKLAPPTHPYLHNDLDFRAGPPDWPGGDEAWRKFRAGEPVNAHSHLIAFVLGTSESIPIHKGAMKIGTYQNIIIADADGPVGPLGNAKTRTIAVQVMGSK